MDAHVSSHPIDDRGGVGPVVAELFDFFLFPGFEDFGWEVGGGIEAGGG